MTTTIILAATIGAIPGLIAAYLINIRAENDHADAAEEIGNLRRDLADEAARRMYVEYALAIARDEIDAYRAAAGTRRYREAAIATVREAAGEGIAVDAGRLFRGEAS